MKKSVIAVFAGLAATAAFAGMNNVLVSFSTVGPDCYADGATVLDGECSALVWTPYPMQSFTAEAEANPAVFPYTTLMPTRPDMPGNGASTTLLWAFLPATHSTSHVLLPICSAMQASHGKI